MDKLKVLTGALALAVALVSAGWMTNLDAIIRERELLGFLLFFLINVLAETKPLVLPNPRASQAEITVSASYALVALFPPLYAALIGSCAVLLTEALVKRKAPVKCCFNTCQTFLSLGAAAVAYALVAAGQPAGHFTTSLLAMTGAAFAYFLANTGLVSLGVWCLHGTPPWRNWAAQYRWQVLYIAASVPFAMLLVLAYDRLWIAGPLFFLGPLFLLRESYAQYVRLKTNYTETVRTLVKVIETHDTYTAGHSLRVAEYAKRLAHALKLSTREAEKVEIAAYLHDLGKVDLAITNLVKKPDALTLEEKMRIELHPIVSAELAGQVTLFRGDIEEIICCHHENHDGSGYPYGLSGDEIPLGARILHVVDAFDAMTSSRVYRPALTLEDVKGRLRSASGTQFDPRVIAVFLDTCVKDETSILAQVEPAYEETLSRKLLEVRSRKAARQRAQEPVAAYA